MQRYKTAIVTLTVLAGFLLGANLLAFRLIAQDGGRFVMIQTDVARGPFKWPEDKTTDADLTKIIEQYFSATLSDSEPKPKILKITAKGSTRDFWMKRDLRAEFSPIWIDDDGNDRGHYGVVAKLKSKGAETSKLFILKDGKVIETFTHYQHRPNALSGQKVSSDRRSSP